METIGEYEKRLNKNKMEKNNDVQRSIIRQSSLKVTLDFYNKIDHIPSLIEFIRLSEIISDYVQDGITPEIKTIAKKFDEVIKKSDK